MIALLLVACDEPTEAPYDPGFTVVGVSPADGATDVVEAQIPELHFSDPADPLTCTADSLRVDAIHDDDTVAFSVEVTIVPQDDGYRIQLAHDAPLPRGWTYALSARAGDDDGCLDLEGEALHPFASTFQVP